MWTIAEFAFYFYISIGLRLLIFDQYFFYRGITIHKFLNSYSTFSLLRTYIALQTQAICLLYATNKNPYLPLILTFCITYTFLIEGHGCNKHLCHRPNFKERFKKFPYHHIKILKSVYTIKTYFKFCLCPKILFF